MKKTTWFSLFPPALVLAALAAAAGFFGKNFYHNDLTLMAIKLRVNDLVLLALVIPLGIVMFILAHKGRIWARIFVLGIFMYLMFTYGINTFSIHFNVLFLVYVALLGLCVFSIVTGLPVVAQMINISSKFPRRKLISASLLFIAVSACGFWLSEIISSMINGTVPQSIQGMNLPVNAACVLDIAFMIPLMCIGAVKLWKSQAFGLTLSTVMLIWVLLTSITVISMELGLGSAGLEADLGKLIAFSFNGVLSFVMIIIVCIPGVNR